MNFFRIIWRALTTEAPLVGERWVHRANGRTTVKVLNTQDKITTFHCPDGVTRRLPEGEFVCFWRPATTTTKGRKP